MLGLLADNGGPTWTMALAPGSPAIDLGNAQGAPPSDQRGVPRPSGSGVDIGAFEFTPQGPPLIWLMASAQIQVKFTAQPNAGYLLQSSPDLVQWTTEETIAPCASATECVRQFNRSAAPQRFFRLQVQ
jgi:hypothetical protein